MKVSNTAEEADCGGGGGGGVEGSNEVLEILM